MEGRRWVMAAVAVADAVLLAGALGVAATHDGRAERAGEFPSTLGGGPAAGTFDPATEVPVPGGTSGLAARRSVSAGDVAKRPWPPRVAAPGPWSSTLAGRGDRLTLAVPGTVRGATDGVWADLGSGQRQGEELSSGRVLALPGGARWRAVGRTRFEGLGEVPFTSATAAGEELSVIMPSLEALIGSAAVTGVGTFVQADGTDADRLALPPGTRLVFECREPTGSVPCQERSVTPVRVEVVAAPGLSIRAGGPGEVAVTGSARATALGHTWEGLVAAIDAQQLGASATYTDEGWTVAAQGADARQVWVDVWPVIDTRLSARSVARGSPGFLDSLRGDTYPVGIQWTNVGFATSQILEAEGVGPGAGTVAFDINQTQGHDAGLGVRRGDRVVNLRDGADIDSHLAPGESVDRGLSAPGGTNATIVLRGNFPDVPVPLAVPRG